MKQHWTVQKLCIHIDTVHIYLDANCESISTPCVPATNAINLLLHAKYLTVHAQYPTYSMQSKVSVTYLTAHAKYPTYSTYKAKYLQNIYMQSILRTVHAKQSILQ